jgi:hypothetical protein
MPHLRVLRPVTVRLGTPDDFMQRVSDDGRCQRCGHISALSPCNTCAGRFVRLLKPEPIVRFDPVSFSFKRAER